LRGGELDRVRASGAADNVPAALVHEIGRLTAIGADRRPTAVAEAPASTAASAPEGA